MSWNFQWDKQLKDSSGLIDAWLIQMQKDGLYGIMIIKPSQLHDAMESAQQKPAKWEYEMNKLPDVTLPPTVTDGSDERITQDYTPFLDTEAVFDIIEEELGEEEAKALTVDTDDYNSCACGHHPVKK